VGSLHLASAALVAEGSWREILEYFDPPFQIGMTATPLRDDNRDTYRYFGNPICTYRLRRGIEDEFLAPYRVHRRPLSRNSRREPSAVRGRWRSPRQMKLANAMCRYRELPAQGELRDTM
jgi:superfamily II DNA or RNA helicase